MIPLIIPFGYDPLWTLLIAVICVGLVWRLRTLITRILEKFGMASHKLYLNALILIALVLSPFWLLFFFYTLQALLGVILSNTSDGDSLTHYGALSALTLTLGVLIAGPLLLVKAFINERQTATAEASQTTREHGQITDRFTNAVNQLGAQKTVHKRAPQPVYKTNPDGTYLTDTQGKLIPQHTEHGKVIAKWESWTETEPNLEIRLGGLFSLERISQISEHEHVAVMETICAYIRENAQSCIEIEETEDSPTQYTAPRADIQMAIKILGRRGTDRIKLEAQIDPPYRLDLRGAGLAIIDFSDGKFGPARMQRTNLCSAWLDNTSFRGADFSSANMSDAWLEDADFQGACMEETILNGAWAIGANLQGTTMNGAELRRAKMIKTNLLGADLDGVYLENTNISGANMHLVWLRNVDCRGFDNLSKNQIDSASGDLTTTLPNSFTRPLWPRQQITYMESFEMWVDAKKQKGLF